MIVVTVTTWRSPLNQQQWTTVVDRTKVPCRSWQNVSFDRQTACFVRIVGTHNTANEVFHCVHFECPALSVTCREENSEDPTSSDHSTPSGLSIAHRSVNSSLAHTLTESNPRNQGQQK
ncbi:hypothetical protein GDO86_019507 [Hymenochirus boettgeri]|uniref:Uncharacterized protein n=1 Tax=Hymenochirus boettgeri TaxID=247094 RepID=A0A8T2ILK3_9PIPI|nr:hypothetical protein GDO86_019507 [Hymenochirus boettgeri]